MARGRSDDLPAGSQPVCPRCGGTAPDEAVWCEGCGLNLKKEKELPTADAYSARIREERWLEQQEAEKKGRAEGERKRRAEWLAEKEEARKQEDEKRGAEREGRGQERREAIRARKGVLLRAGLALAAIVALLVTWQVSEDDVPVIGKSPLLSSGSADVPQQSSPTSEINSAQLADAVRSAYARLITETKEKYGDDTTSDVRVDGVSCNPETDQWRCTIDTTYSHVSGYSEQIPLPYRISIDEAGCFTGDFAGPDQTFNDVTRISGCLSDQGGTGAAPQETSDASIGSAEALAESTITADFGPTDTTTTSSFRSKIDATWLLVTGFTPEPHQRAWAAWFRLTGGRWILNKSELPWSQGPPRPRLVTSQSRTLKAAPAVASSTDFPP